MSVRLTGDVLPSSIGAPLNVSVIVSPLAVTVASVPSASVTVCSLSVQPFILAVSSVYVTDVASALSKAAVLFVSAILRSLVSSTTPVYFSVTSLVFITSPFLNVSVAVVVFSVSLMYGSVSVSVIVSFPVTATVPPSTPMFVAAVFWSSQPSTGVYWYVATLLSVPSFAVSFALFRLISGTASSPPTI